MSEKETFNKLDDAIRAHVKESSGDDVITTGWVLVASASSLAYDSNGEDGYVTFASPGLPHHSQVGLLTIANDDKKNMALLASIGHAASMDFDEDEWDGDE